VPESLTHDTGTPAGTDGAWFILPKEAEPNPGPFSIELPACFCHRHSLKGDVSGETSWPSRPCGPTASYRLWHLPARLVRHARKRVLKISVTWPWEKAIPIC
jgi:hypothetical protein